MTYSIKDNSRLTKIFAEKNLLTFEEADVLVNKQTLVVFIDEESSKTLAGQGAALTILATASRCFQGGVELRGDLKAKCLLGLPFETIGAAAEAFGAKKVSADSFVIFVGGVPKDFRGRGIQVWWDRWRAGIRPSFAPQQCGGGKVVLAGVAAAGVAVSQAFTAVFFKDKLAGREPWDVNLWDPTDKEGIGPARVCLPLNLWFIGMGNLGQAFLWSFLLLPFRKPQNVQTVFQDFDFIKIENWITSILTTKDWVGKKKTALALHWASQKGFNVSLFDFKLTEKFVHPTDEPFYALAGLDSMEARKLLVYCKFPYLLSAGLGSTADNFHSFDIDIFDELWGPEKCYGETADIKRDIGAANLKKEAYKKHLGKDEATKCGMVEIAESSAAVPFVSAFVGALAITRMIQLASDIRPDRVTSGSTAQLTPLRVWPKPEFGKNHLGLYSEAMDCE